MAGKRSNPANLLKEREAIVKDLEEREHIPQSKRMFPNLEERLHRSVNKVLKPLDDAIFMKQLRKNPPPSKAGAKVIGFKKPNSTA
jgi:hypothetical protein